jgi:hypothetical protein
MCTPVSDNPYRHCTTRNILFDVLSCRLSNLTTNASFPQAVPDNDDACAFSTPYI